MSLIRRLVAPEAGGPEPAPGAADREWAPGAAGQGWVELPVLRARRAPEVAGSRWGVAKGLEPGRAAPRVAERAPALIRRPR